MTGAGSGELLFAHEQSLGGQLVDSDSSGTPETYSPGRNESLTELDLNRQLQRLREAGAVESVESVAQNLEGAVAVEAIVSNDVHGQVEQHVFNDGGAGFVAGRPNTASYFVGCDFLDGTATRQLKGCIPLDYSLDYEEGGMFTYTLTMGYMDEERDVTIPTGEVTRVSDGTSVPHHGITLDVDGATVSKLQSASLSISEIARFQFGASYKAEDAVIAAPTTTLDLDAIITGTSRQELAYGADAATTPQSSMSSVPATLTITVDGTTVSTYNLPAVKPDSYGWADVVAGDADTTESVSFHVNDGVSIT